jgi:hypothetical protein
MECVVRVHAANLSPPRSPANGASRHRWFDFPNPDGGGTRTTAELVFQLVEKSLLIDANHQFCNDIQPGSTETFRLLFKVPEWATTIAGVALAHRSSPADHFSHAFVTR